MGYWNKIASVQKSKIISTHSGQQIDLRSFFPVVEGNWYVTAQIGSVFSNNRWVSGIRAVVEDLGNYNYRGWTQCSNSYLDFQVGTIIVGGIETMTGDWRSIGPNETHNYQNFDDVRCRVFGWTLYGNGSFVGTNGRIIMGDNSGQYVNDIYNSSNHHRSSFETPTIPYNSSNMYVINQGNATLRYNLAIYRSRWENCEGIVNLFISEARY